MPTTYLSLLVISLALALVAQPLRPERQRPEGLQQADTAWVDDPRPYLATDVIQQLEEIWSQGHDAGACLIGSVEQTDGRLRVRVTTVTGAAFPERCTGFTRYVGAAIFVRERADGPSEEELEGAARESACALLRKRAGWAVAAAVFGFRQRLTTREGELVPELGEPRAWFCTWQKSKVDRQEAVPGDSIRSG